DRLATCRLHCRTHLRLLRISLPSLQSSRTPDDAVDATGTVGTAPVNEPGFGIRPSRASVRPELVEGRDPGSEAVVVRPRLRDRAGSAALLLDVLRGVLRRVLRAHRSRPSDRASAIGSATRAASCGLCGNCRDRGASTRSRVYGSGANER